MVGILSSLDLQIHLFLSSRLDSNMQSFVPSFEQISFDQLRQHFSNRFVFYFRIKFFFFVLYHSISLSLFTPSSSPFDYETPSGNVFQAINLHEYDRIVLLTLTLNIHKKIDVAFFIRFIFLFYHSRPFSLSL